MPLLGRTSARLRVLGLASAQLAENSSHGHDAITLPHPHPASVVGRPAQPNYRLLQVRVLQTEGVNESCDSCHAAASVGTACSSTRWSNQKRPRAASSARSRAALSCGVSFAMASALAAASAVSAAERPCSALSAAARQSAKPLPSESAVVIAS